MPRYPDRTVPPPLLEIAVEPKSAGDREEFRAAIVALSRQDATLSVWTDQDSGQTLLGGQSETQLDAFVGRLRQECGGRLAIGQPQISYRETISHPCEVDYTHKKLFQGIGQFARVKLRLEPGLAGSGAVLRTAPFDADIPQVFLTGAEKGVHSVLGAGISAGFPVTDIVVTILSGAWYEEDTSELSVEIAARAALREGLQKAGSILLEPIMDVRIVLPENFLAAALRDLGARRALIERHEVEEGRAIIGAQVPLSNLFGYRNSLNAMTRGSDADFEMRFRDYAPVPRVEPPDDPRFPPAMAMRA